MSRCKSLYHCSLLGIFILFAINVSAQEICNNGKDDDGDGLIDLRDPACQCKYVVKDNLLQNGSFESFDHCPTYGYDNDYNNVNYWQYGTYTNINEADFYHNFTCSYDSQQVMRYMPPVVPLPDGNAFISLLNTPYINTSVPEKEMTKSYVGQCLQTPLKSGEDYTISFYAGRFRSWDNPSGKLFPFTVAVFGNTDCNAVPFGRPNVLGNGCPSNYSGWVLLGKTTVQTKRQWVQSKISFTAPADIKVIQIGVDCSILPPVIDLADSTTYLDYHVFYLDDVHLLPTKNFPFKYIRAKTNLQCSGYPLLIAPVISNASFQWYRDSIAINGATDSVYQVADTIQSHYYNVVITTDTGCIVSEPFLVTPDNLYKINIPKDTFFCTGTSLSLASAYDGIVYSVNGVRSSSVTINKQGYYSITATNVYGCERNFNVNVTEENCAGCEAFVPTAFTPNGDGLNDEFKAKILCPASSFNLIVFNRWGEKIFASSDINKGWDGNYRGNKMPSGSYVYFIDYKTIAGARKSLRGTIVLMR